MSLAAPLTRASSEPRPLDGVRRNSRQGNLKYQARCFLRPPAQKSRIDGLLGPAPLVGVMFASTMLSGLLRRRPSPGWPHCPLSRSVLFNSHRQLQRTGKRIRWCHDPDNVVLKQQELSLVDGFSLMIGSEGANHQLRRAINSLIPLSGNLFIGRPAPQPDRPVPTSAGERPPVWREGHRPDSIPVPFERLELSAALPVPQLDRTVRTSAGERPPVWREGHRVDNICPVPFERL